MNRPYVDVYKEMFELSCKTCYVVNSIMLIDKYLFSQGWIKLVQPRKKDNTKYTGKEFCKKIQEDIDLKDLYTSENIIANIGGHHIVAIIKGVINDIWDSTERCIGNYWRKIK